MRIEDFERLFRERCARSEMSGSLTHADPDELSIAANRFGLEVPRLVTLFFEKFGEVRVETPFLFVRRPMDWKRRGDLVLFCQIGSPERWLAFVPERNQAHDWSIVDADSGYLVTLTMSSFWSNKIFAWLDSKREIWLPYPAS